MGMVNEVRVLPSEMLQPEQHEQTLDSQTQNAEYTDGGKNCQYYDRAFNRMSAQPPRLPIEQRTIRLLGWTERVFFAVIALLLFAGAVALLMHATAHLATMFAPGDIINETTTFLDLVLGTLMIVELAYTVILSLRGAVLHAEPFLIVALIAVIRRILVITAGHAGAGEGSVVASTQSLLELAVLTLVVLVFVASILALRSRPPDRSLDIFAQDE
jgi:uncharacterized membrane protein (DUF373 family)